MFRKWIGETNRFIEVFIITGTLFLSGCLPEKTENIEPKAFFEELDNAGIHPQVLNPISFPKLTNAVHGNAPIGIYSFQKCEWALFDLRFDDNITLRLNYISNKNLYLVSEHSIPDELSQVLLNLSPRIGYEQLGILHTRSGYA